MWPVIFTFMRSYAPYVTLPIAVVVGVIGYNVEGLLSDKQTPSVDSIKEKRQERLLADPELDGSLKEKKFVPRTIFEKNVSPSLQEK